MSFFAIFDFLGDICKYLGYPLTQRKTKRIY